MRTSRKTDDLSNFDLESKKFGKFKNEIKNCKKILSFHALSPYSTHINYLSSSDELKSVSKICGFSINNTLNPTKISKSLFERFISQGLNGTLQAEPLKQIRHYVDKDSYEVRKKVMTHQLRNTLSKDRVVFENCTSLPYGYSKQLYDRTMNM